MPTNVSPSGSKSTTQLPFPISGEITLGAKSPRLNIIGDPTGSTGGYPVGLVCKLDFAAGTATPLAADPVAEDVIGILLDPVNSLLPTAKSTQQFNLIYRDVGIISRGLVLNTGIDLTTVTNHFRDVQNCGIIN